MPKRKRISGKKKCDVKELTKNLKEIQEWFNLLDSSDSSSTSSETSDSLSSNIEDHVDIENPVENIEKQIPEEHVGIDFDLFDQARIGAPIHQEIAARWSTTLQAGLTAAESTEIAEKFKIPENCLPLIPPKTNEEIQPCLPEGAARHDKIIITFPQKRSGPKKVKLAPETEKFYQSNGGDIRDSVKVSLAFKLPAPSTQGEVQRSQQGGEVSSSEEEREPEQGTGISIPSPQVNHSPNKVTT
nr:unnamed protein product [Callosobruchus analis]